MSGPATPTTAPHGARRSAGRSSRLPARTTAASLLKKSPGACGQAFSLPGTSSPPQVVPPASAAARAAALAGGTTCGGLDVPGRLNACPQAPGLFFSRLAAVVRAGSLEDRPADLRAPCGAVVGVAGPDMVDLTHGPCDSEGLVAHVGAESRVGDVDVVMLASVDRGGQVDGRDDERCHRPAAGGIGDRDIGHHGASFLGEQ